MPSNGAPDEKRVKIEDSKVPLRPQHQPQDEDKEFHLALEEIDNCQTQIDSLNERAAEEILSVEVRYNELRKPHYVKRAEYIARVPEFWATVFMNHPHLSLLINEEEHRCLQYLKDFAIEEFEDIKDGYKIIFKFEPNPYFENESLVKEFRIGTEGPPKSIFTAIKWKPGKNLLAASDKDSRKRKASGSFFSWFTDAKNSSVDTIADCFKDEIWPNPLQYFMMPEVEEDDEDDEGEAGDVEEEDEDEENQEEEIEDEENEDEDDDV